MRSGPGPATSLRSDACTALPFIRHRPELRVSQAPESDTDCMKQVGPCGLFHTSEERDNAVCMCADTVVRPEWGLRGVIFPLRATSVPERSCVGEGSPCAGSAYRLAREALSAHWRVERTPLALPRLWGAKVKGPFASARCQHRKPPLNPVAVLNGSSLRRRTVSPTGAEM